MLIQHIIIQEPHRNNIYYFRPAMAFLLHKVSGATLEDISRTRIYSRTLLRYIPFYRSANGGGAITLGSGKWCSITYTENFFSDNNSRFANRAYANRLYAWIRLSAHSEQQKVETIELWWQDFMSLQRV